MSYTNTEQVRHHLVVPHPVQDRATDQPVTIEASESTGFYGGSD